MWAADVARAAAVVVAAEAAAMMVAGRAAVVRLQGGLLHMFVLLVPVKKRTRYTIQYCVMLLYN